MQSNVVEIKQSEKYKPGAKIQTFTYASKFIKELKMTITLDELVCEGLWPTIGKRRMSQFIEDLLRSHGLTTALDDSYRLYR